MCVRGMGGVFWVCGEVCRCEEVCVDVFWVWGGV